MIKIELIPGKHFIPDFARVILREDGGFEFIINRRVSFLFSNLFILHEDATVYLTLKEIIANLNIFEESNRSIDRKIKLFTPHEEDRIKRYFDGDSKSIFFDSEQCYKLEEAFDKYSLMGDAVILFDGEEVELGKLKPADQTAVIDSMVILGLVYDVHPDEYKGFSNIKRAKIVAKRTKYQEGGVKIMSKSKLMWKAIGGSLLMATGSGVLITGIAVFAKSASTLLGIEKEVILVEDDEE